MVVVKMHQLFPSNCTYIINSFKVPLEVIKYKSPDTQQLLADIKIV